MLSLTVPDMHCGGCAASVQKAIQSVDHAARVEVDLATRRVVVDTTATSAQVAEAVERAGFDAQPA